MVSREWLLEASAVAARQYDLAPLISTRHPVFSVKACDLPYQLRQSYRITRCHDQTIWEITDIQPDGVSRLSIDVVQLGRASQLEKPAR